MALYVDAHFSELAGCHPAVHELSSCRHSLGLEKSSLFLVPYCQCYSAEGRVWTNDQTQQLEMILVWLRCSLAQVLQV